MYTKALKIKHILKLINAIIYTLEDEELDTIAKILITASNRLKQQAQKLHRPI